MLKEEITILIVDDDMTLGAALQKAFARAGFKSTHVSKPDEALSTAKLLPLHGVVIDCMLPKMNGRDLAKKLKAEVSKKLPVALMSGIYKDRNFIRDALKATGAFTYFTKPFDVADVVKGFESQLDAVIDTPLVPLQELLTKAEPSHKERIRAINAMGDVHGFELPWVYSLLLHPKVSGHLNIISADGEVSGVGFQNGEIVHVNQKDAKSFFGILMVEHGFVTQEEIESVLKINHGTKRLGELLIEANLLSPHAIDVVMAEQQGLRLSKTVGNTSVKINFVESDDIRRDATLSKTAFFNLLNEWMISKLTLDWLKSAYLPWMQYNCRSGQESTADHPCLHLPTVQRVPKMMSTLLQSDSLEQALSTIKAPEELVYRALHTLIVARLIRFGNQRAQIDYESHRRRLMKISAELTHQNYFERLGVSSKAKDSEIKRSYHELAKILHPDKLGPDAPKDVRDISRKAFSMISDAHSTLSDPSARANYMLELEQGRAEAVLEAEQLSERARSLLTQGDISRSRELLDRAISLAPPTSETRLLHMWAQLKAAGSEENPELLNSVREELQKIPPEERHVPSYYFVKGLLLKASGDLEGAMKSLEHAVQISPNFIDARRELNVINLRKSSNKPTDLLRGDLKDVVGMLFKKKK